MNEHPTGDASSPASPRRLSKRDVETLLATYDSDPVAALTQSLLTLAAPIDLVASLGSMSETERDQMVKDLVEWRALSPRHSL